MKQLLTIIMIALSSTGLAAPHFHSTTVKMKAPKAKTNEEINERYVKQVKPLLKRTCFDCHSGNTIYPWYHSIPGVKQIINNDIEEGRDHLDMSQDYPFFGKIKQEEQLKEILEEIKEGGMPPLPYKLLHWSSRLSQEEINVIESWIKWAEEGKN